MTEGEEQTHTPPESNPDYWSDNQPPKQLHEFVRIVIALVIVIILVVTTVMLFLRSNIWLG